MTLLTFLDPIRDFDAIALIEVFHFVGAAELVMLMKEHMG